MSRVRYSSSVPNSAGIGNTGIVKEQDPAAVLHVQAAGDDHNLLSAAAEQDDASEGDIQVSVPEFSTASEVKRALVKLTDEKLCICR